jgi:hypothetical protein
MFSKRQYEIGSRLKNKMGNIIVSSILFLFLSVGIFASATYAQGNQANRAFKKREGRIELRVWDRSAKKHIYAGLGFYPQIRQKNFYSMSTATGDDGEAHTLTLRSGKYLAKVERYLCGDKNYFAANPPTFWLSVRAGRLSRKTLKVDVSKIRAKRSYDNLDGKACFK